MCLARALSTDPELLIADEPASALDVSIQAQIINLLLDLKAKRGLNMVLISHDLALVSLMADRLAVMYGGLLMEVFPRASLGAKNHHPNIKALFASAILCTSAFFLSAPPLPERMSKNSPANFASIVFSERLRAASSIQRMDRLSRRAAFTSVGTW